MSPFSPVRPLNGRYNLASVCRAVRMLNADSKSAHPGAGR